MRANNIAAAILGYLAELIEPVARLIDHLVIALHPSCRRDPAVARIAIAVPPGLYRDRFGALWERTTTGWRLWLRAGLMTHSPSRW